MNVWQTARKLLGLKTTERLLPSTDIGFAGVRMPGDPRPVAQDEDPAAVTARARAEYPTEAKEADDAFELFFKTFPWARGTFEIRYIADPRKVGGEHVLRWDGPPLIMINLLGEKDIEDGWRVDGGSVYGNVLHECGHFLGLIDGLLHNGHTHIRSMVSEELGIPSIAALQTDAEVVSLLSKDVSKYGARALRELIPECVVAGFRGETKGPVSRRVGNHYLQQYGRYATPSLFEGLLTRPLGSGYVLPDGTYGRLSTYPGLYTTIGSETYVRTRSQILHIQMGHIRALRPDSRGRLIEDYLGASRRIDMGEPLLSPADDNGIGKPLSDEVTEVFIFSTNAHRDADRAVDASHPRTIVHHDVPAVVAEYDGARFRSMDRTDQLDVPFRYAQTPQGFITIAIDTPGTTIGFDELVEPFGASPTVFLEDYSGGRYEIRPFEATALTGSGGRARLTHCNGYRYEKPLTISRTTQTLDFGEGRVLEINGVKRIEVEPAALRLSNAMCEALEPQRSTLWNTQQILDSHQSKQVDAPPTPAPVLTQSSGALDWL